MRSRLFEQFEDVESETCIRRLSVERVELNFDYTNDWTAVIFPPERTPVVIHGTIPRKILQHFTSNRAHTYFLEAWAAIITPVLIQPLLTQPYIQLCDNDPATHAINRGSGRRQPLNNLIGSGWEWHNRQQLTQILGRVPSKANIADPFSRRDFSISDSLGWRVLSTPTEHLVPTIHKVAGNPSFAHKTGFNCNPSVQSFHKQL